MNRQARIILLTAIVLMIFAIVVGAFGAHGLKERVSPDMFVIYHTGLDYHYIHTLGMLLIGILMHQIPGSRWLLFAAIAMVGGIVLFSGNLYLYAVTGKKLVAMLTPVGGLSFMLGWILMAVGVLRYQKT